MIRAELQPRGPYSLLRSGRLASDATRVVRDGGYRGVVEVDGALETVRAAQRADGTVVVAAESEAGVEHVRFVLGLDDDHTAFLRRFAHDPLIGEATRRFPGLRPIRTATVAQSLLRAVAGQLIEAKRARAIERAVIRAVTRRHGDLHAAPTCADLAKLAPAELRRLGLGTRRGAALVRICRELELERLRLQPTGVVAARLEGERGLGPWSVGVVCLEGLGRYERGLARDLGLVKLASELWGRYVVDAAETDILLEPYGEWAGLGSVYLLAAYHTGLVPLPHAHRNSRRRQDRRVAPRRAA